MVVISNAYIVRMRGHFFKEHLMCVLIKNKIKAVVSNIKYKRAPAEIA